jgi:epsilon-lactone hydrolase
MQSLKSKFFSSLLLLNKRLHIGLHKKGMDWNSFESIISFREQCEKGASRAKVQEGIEIAPVLIEGIKAEWITPVNGTKDKVIFYTHGGGYVSGSCSDHRAVVAKFVKGSGIGALLFEYRLAPEHPYPAAVEDSVKVYSWLLKQSVLPSNIVIAGESAGGGLGLAVSLALRDRNIPLPAAVVAISPWTDLKCKGESYKRNAKACLSPLGTWDAFSKHYVGDNDPGIPLISPLYGDLHGLPATLIYAGGNEILCDDSIQFADKAEKAGVDVKLKIGKGMFHCYPVCSPLFPEARTAMNEICGFIKTHI